MPLTVKDYTWRQTENTVVIRVPLKGVHSSKVDIFSSDNYVKAHFQQYFFEVFLFADVRDTDSTCTLANDEIVFELHKVECINWERLDSNLSKQEKRDRRKMILEKAQEKAQEEIKKKSEMKQELGRLAVKQQIAIDTAHREQIEAIKENEKKVAMKEFEEWKVTQEAKENVVKLGNNDIHKTTNVCTSMSDNTIFQEDGDEESNDEVEEEDVEDDMVKPMPLPRTSGKIQVSFTPRAFPTPKRESQAQDEEEWLKKQAEARRRVGFVAEDLSPEELDPVWLKDKGDSFFKVENYLGAISAYSHAIKLGSKMPALYSNRAAAHMAMGNCNRCVEDCSTALDLLTPKVSLNALSRARCHARRGTALCKLGMVHQGMGELEAAVYLQPDDDKLRMDLEKARAMVDVSISADDLD